MIVQPPLQVKLKESDVPMTSFAGAGVLVQVAHQTGLLAELDRHLPLKQRRRGLSAGTSVLDLMLLSCAGGECIDDLEVLRSDQGLRRLLARPVMAPSTAHDFLRRFDAAGREGLAGARRHLLRQVAQGTKQERATLDCDASFFASGVREAKMSYLGERGWMPMMAFWAELDLIVHDEFRPGNMAPQSDAVGFLKETVAQLPEAVQAIRVRSDSAWYQADVLDYCQREGYGFSITADKDSAVQALLAGVCESDWQRVHVPPEPSEAEDWLREWAYETVHTLERSEFSYRMILLRKERRQPDLFEGEYVYGAIITNLDLPLESQLRWHRQRCNCENHIKELKQGFSMRGLPSGDFEVNAAYFRIGTLAYNLISALKWLRLDASWRPLTMKTLRFRLLALPALVVRHARRLWLHLPRGHPHLAAFRAALI
jgi:hypothetical protein